jgi:V/A-type H+/Na+-transporting ATPase subunit D
MDAVVPTRSALLECRRRVALAEQGRDLLSDKRAALVRAFAERGAALLSRLAEAEHSAATARVVLDDAYAAIGARSLGSAALAVSRRIGVEVVAEVVAGVVVVDLVHDPVQRLPWERGYGVSTTDPIVDEVATAYEAQIDDVLDLAALELTVRRLAAEIARTTRQVNALEYVLIPRLGAESRLITFALEEREREEVARLRRARDNRRRRRLQDT